MTRNFFPLAIPSSLSATTALSSTAADARPQTLPTVLRSTTQSSSSSSSSSPIAPGISTSTSMPSAVRPPGSRPVNAQQLIPKKSYSSSSIPTGAARGSPAPPGAKSGSLYVVISEELATKNTGLQLSIKKTAGLAFKVAKSIDADL